MKPFFTELFEYSHHTNQKLAGIFIKHPKQTSEKAVRLFNHILNAHQIWNQRIETTQITFGVWDIHPIEDLLSIDKTNYQNTLHILEQYDLNTATTYTNTKGDTFDNSIRDILFHIVNHSTYHRGQIASEFRQNGLDPLVTDYIFFKR